MRWNENSQWYQCLGIHLLSINLWLFSKTTLSPNVNFIIANLTQQQRAEKIAHNITAYPTMCWSRLLSYISQYSRAVSPNWTCEIFRFISSGLRSCRQSISANAIVVLGVSDPQKRLICKLQLCLPGTDNAGQISHWLWWRRRWDVNNTYPSLERYF